VWDSFVLAESPFTSSLFYLNEGKYHPGRAAALETQVALQSGR